MAIETGTRVRCVVGFYPRSLWIRYRRPPVIEPPVVEFTSAMERIVQLVSFEADVDEVMDRATFRHFCDEAGSLNLGQIGTTAVEGQQDTHAGGRAL